MQEDPSAKRNRGNAIGLWIIGALAGLVVILVTIEVLRPVPVSVAPPEAAAISVKQRVANDQAAAARREASRPQP